MLSLELAQSVPSRLMARAVFAVETTGVCTESQREHGYPHNGK